MDSWGSVLALDEQWSRHSREHGERNSTGFDIQLS